MEDKVKLIRDTHQRSQHTEQEYFFVKQAKAPSFGICASPIVLEYNNHCYRPHLVYKGVEAMSRSRILAVQIFGELRFHFI